MPENTTTQPPVMNSTVIISHPLQSLVIGHTFLVLLFPFLGALFYYSTPHSRCQPIFVLNVLSLTLALIVGIASDAMDIHAILSPESGLSSQIATGAISLFQGMLVDAILLVRLITVHPLSHLGFVRFAFLVSLPMTLKIARVVNAILYINRLCVFAEGPNAAQEIDVAWLAMPYMKIEWIAQVVDNGYVSVAFLWTLWHFRTDTTSDGLMSALTLRQTPMSKRIRILCHLALSNFMIPTLFSFAQLLLAFRICDADPLTLNAIVLVNPTLAAFGVVFATVWAGKERRREEKVYQLPFIVEHEPPRRIHALDESTVESQPADHPASERAV